MNPICWFWGHTPTGEITGFRNEDAAAISRCCRCNTPIVNPKWRASRYIMVDLQRAERMRSAADDERRWSARRPRRDPNAPKTLGIRLSLTEIKVSKVPIEAMMTEKLMEHGVRLNVWAARGFFTDWNVFSEAEGGEIMDEALRQAEVKLVMSYTDQESGYIEMLFRLK